MTSTYIIIASLVSVGAVIAVRTHRLTVQAGIAGWLIALVMLYAIGHSAIAAMAAFFLLGTLSTSFRIGTKQRLNIAERDKGNRTAAQVFANAGVPFIIAGLALADPGHHPLYTLMIAAAFSAATADTMSSELGNLYGSKYYDIISFRRGTRGHNGVISIEGTLIGIAGSAIIAVVYALFHGFTYHVFIIIIAGLIGNLADSIIGATLERRGAIQNNTVNFINTATGALAAWGLSAVFY